jgi:DNA mismatch repair protein MutS2
LNPDELRAEDLLNEIHHQRDLARTARTQADNERREAERLKVELARRLEKIEDERRTVLENARMKSEKEVAALEEELNTLRRQLTRARQPLDALKPLQDQVAEMSAAVQHPVERQAVQETASRPLRLGDKVRVRSIKMEGVISAISDSDFEVQVGNLRVRARQSDLVRANQPEPQAAEEAPPKPVQTRSKAAGDAGKSAPSLFHPSPGMELDLRGQRAEDALDALDRYLESAYMAGLPFVRIIHGKGTGRLRQVIRESLSHSPHVKNWESGAEKEGGEGVTVARLVT